MKTIIKIRVILIALPVALVAVWGLSQLPYCSGEFKYRGWTGIGLELRIKALTREGFSAPDSVLQSRWIDELMAAVEKKGLENLRGEHGVAQFMGLTPSAIVDNRETPFFSRLNDSIDCEEVVDRVPRYLPGYLYYPGDRSLLSMDRLNELINSRSYRASEKDRAFHSVLSDRLIDSPDTLSAVLREASTCVLYSAGKIMNHDKDTIHRCVVFACGPRGDLIAVFRVDLIEKFSFEL